MRARALTGAALGLLLGGALVGCREAPPVTGLPDTLSAVLSTTDGRLMSLLVELPRPGVEPIVRLSPGAVAVDRGLVMVWLESVQAGGATQGLVMDLGSGQEHTYPMSGPTQLLSLSREGVIVQDRAGRWQLAAGPEAVAVEHEGPALPGGTTMHAGPAGGFAARVEDGRLELRLPGDSPSWDAIAHDVDAILGCWWFVSGSLPRWQRRVVDDRFKQVGLVRADVGLAVVDGSLAEWRGQQALRVDGPSQILLGQAGWRGVRDGGMGVAARRQDDGSLVLAVRVRDDAWMPGRDLLIVRQHDQEILLSLTVDGLQEGPGWTAVVAPISRSERAVELRLEDGPDKPGPVAGLMVELVDADPGEPTTLLATAPWPAAVALGALALTPDGPDRPAPQ